MHHVNIKRACLTNTKLIQIWILGRLMDSNTVNRDILGLMAQWV